MLKFWVTNQTIALTSTVKVVEGSVNFVKCYFEFGNEWEGFIKTALFKQNDVVYGVMLDNDRCFLPASLVVGVVNVGMRGTKSDLPDMATTNIVSFEIGKSLIENGIDPPEPTSSEYAQIFALDQLAKRPVEKNFTTTTNLVSGVTTEILLPTSIINGIVTKLFINGTLDSWEETRLISSGNKVLFTPQANFTNAEIVVFYSADPTERPHNY